MATPLFPEPDWLDRCVTVVDAAFADGGWYQPHCLVSVEPDAGFGHEPEAQVEFGFNQLAEGQHPLGVLLGFRAPKAWHGLGAVCFGWAAPGEADPHRHTTTTGARPSAHPDRQRVRVTAIVGRDGVERCTAALEDGSVVDEPGEGTMNDTLRRCLDLPTAPPPVGTSEFFAALWLEHLAAARRSLSWPEVAERHPAVPMFRATGHRLQPEELIAAGRALHRVLGWKQLRARAERGSDERLTSLSPEVAGWMDDGMFARWVLGDITPLPQLLSICTDHLSPQVIRRVRRTLRAWNLDPPLAARAA